MNYDQIFETAARKFAERIQQTNLPTAETFAARENEFAPGLRNGLDYLTRLSQGTIKFGPAQRWSTDESIHDETVDHLNQICIAVSGMNYAQDIGISHIVIDCDKIAFSSVDDIWRNFDDGSRETRVNHALENLYGKALDYGCVAITWARDQETQNPSP
jgi:hypothetical protein